MESNNSTQSEGTKDPKIIIQHFKNMIIPELEKQIKEKNISAENVLDFLQTGINNHKPGFFTIGEEETIV